VKRFEEFIELGIIKKISPAKGVPK